MRIGTALATGDRAQMWAILEATARAGFTGEDTELTPDEELLLGRFAINAGLDVTSDAPERLGELLGVMAMMRVSSREFAASGGR